MTQITLTYSFLLITVLLLLQGNIKAQWVYFGLIATIGAGIYEHYITLLGAGFLIALFICCKVYYSQKSRPWLLNIWLGMILLIAGGLVLHELPGFSNYLIFNNVQISPLSKPYNAFLSIDKVLTAVILYLCSSLWCNQPAINKASLLVTLKMWLLSIVILLGPALLTGYIKFNPKIPSIILYWMVINYFFVCFSEEVIYRGFLQTTLHAKFKSITTKPFFAIIVAAIIFGLAHYRDGLVSMLLAAIAGLFYGYTYYRTQRIKCAMLVHFGVNLTHILLFTYPGVAQLR